MTTAVSPNSASPPTPPAKVNLSDLLMIGCALSAVSAFAVVALKLTGRVSFTKPFSASFIAAVVLGILRTIYKDRQIDLMPFFHSFIPRPTFDTDLYTGEGVVEPFKVGDTKVIPLINRGADCFMNATLQVILHDDLLKAALYQRFKEAVDSTPAMVAFCRVVEFFNEGKTVSTYDLRKFMPDSNQYGQQDAYEFLQQILNYLTPGDHPGLFFPVTTINFWEQKGENGEVISTKETRVTAKEFNSIVQIPDSYKRISGQELIAKHFSKQEIKGDEWVCEENQITYHPAHQQLSFEQPPPRLVFVLKRFGWDRKISTHVDMPEKLVVQGKNYSLKKIIMHHGYSMMSGHYTARLHLDGKWVEANDRTIRDSTDIDYVRQNGYIYFYESE